MSTRQFAPPETRYPDAVETADSPRIIPGAGALALLRVLTGFVFLWAFLDKTFGWRYSTPPSKAWIHGGSPTRGFLASVDVGPLRSQYHQIAGHTWADWLFMLGLLGVGVALVLGVGVRLAALAGVLLMAGMWLAEFPPAQHTQGGAPTVAALAARPAEHVRSQP